jgi:hypothetical protein
MEYRRRSSIYFFEIHYNIHNSIKMAEAVIVGGLYSGSIQLQSLAGCQDVLSGVVPPESFTLLQTLIFYITKSL